MAKKIVGVQQAIIFRVIWTDATDPASFVATSKSEALSQAREYCKNNKTAYKPVKALTPEEYAAYKKDMAVKAAAIKASGPAIKKATPPTPNAVPIMDLLKDTKPAPKKAPAKKAVKATTLAAALGVNVVMVDAQGVHAPKEDPTTAAVDVEIIDDAPHALPPALAAIDKSKQPTELDPATAALLANKAAAVRGLPGLDAIALIGRWLWATFKGKPDDATREQLKEAGWRWAPKKRAWSYHNPTDGKPGKHRAYSWQKLVAVHGIQSFYRAAADTEQ